MIIERLKSLVKLGKYVRTGMKWNDKEGWVFRETTADDQRASSRLVYEVTWYVSIGNRYLHNYGPFLNISSKIDFIEKCTYSTKIVISNQKCSTY